MNYAYSIPFDRMTSAGSSVADFWRLDYSRSAMTGLDETELYETQGLGGPQGRLIFFNYKEETDPEPVKRGAMWADRVTINWTGDQNDPDVAPYQLDITRNDASEPADYDATLDSYTDWDRLWYHLLGTPDFDDRKPSPVATRAEALEETTLEAFANVEWTDFTLLDDLVSANGFELGSATAWSDVVP